MIFLHCRESVCEGDREGLFDDPTARGTNAKVRDGIARKSVREMSCRQDISSE